MNIKGYKILNIVIEGNKNESLTDVFLRGVQEGLDFGDADLKGLVKFRKTGFGELLIKNINFEGANFSECLLSEITFENCNFSDAMFKKSKIEYCNFKNCTLSDTVFLDARITLTDFNQSAMPNTSFVNSELNNCFMSGIKQGFNTNFRYAQLIDSQITESVFKKADFSNATLNNVFIFDSIMTESNFSDTAFGLQWNKPKNLNNFESVNLKGSNFKSADICNLILKQVNLNETDFSSAKLPHQNQDEKSVLIFDNCSMGNMTADVNLENYPLDCIPAQSPAI